MRARPAVRRAEPAVALLAGAILAGALLAALLAGCGGSARTAREQALEARLRRVAVAVRTKPLELDALLEGGDGRASVSWIGPIYPPAPVRYPGPDGSGVSRYRYRYRLGAQPWSAWSSTTTPGFVLAHTHAGERLLLLVQPIDRAGRPRTAARASLTVAGPTLTAGNPGRSEPGEYGGAELYPEQ